MGIRHLKSVTPGSRFATRSDFSELTTNAPYKNLPVLWKKAVVAIIKDGSQSEEEAVGTSVDTG